ncbi:MAG: gluconate permease [Verrucomicrobiae bacterium]|nr:gluconate permease [Verrucomicrobiae bacterium]
MDFQFNPFLILFVGVAIVIGMIIGGRLNAFLALITAALVVSLMAPGEFATKISRVAEAFGGAAGKIGIVIALAAIIGKCLMDSGAADRIVRAFLSALGEKRSSLALAGSGFVLSIPVFFDTVFYLLVPLARSLYRRTHRNYLKYVLAISAGAAVTHTLVPPTPGPLVMADQLGVDIGTMMFAGALCALPAALAGLGFGAWLDRKMPIEMRELTATHEPDPEAEAAAERTLAELPGLFVSLLPIILPVIMITSDTVVSYLAGKEGASESILKLAEWTAVIGNANLALLASAAIALMVYISQCRPTKAGIASSVEEALMSGGVIILITAAGGAFGAMLKVAEIGPAIAGMFSDAKGGGIGLLFLGFLISAMLKFAQGSTTVAVITASSMIAAMIEGTTLGFNPVYIATAIGGGGLIGSWMNDSGFWIFAKMSGLTEAEALKSWTPLLCVLGLVTFLMSVLLSIVLPMKPAAAALVTPEAVDQAVNFLNGWARSLCSAVA